MGFHRIGIDISLVENICPFTALVETVQQAAGLLVGGGNQFPAEGLELTGLVRLDFKCGENDFHTVYANARRKSALTFSHASLAAAS